MEQKPKPYMNPYLAGFLLGLVLLASFFITGRGLGASGAAKSVVVETVGRVAPDYAAEHPFYSAFFADGDGRPMKNWLVYLVIGVLGGAFFSGFMSGRAGFAIDKGPQISNGIRLLFAAMGGILFGLGSQFGRGCTSGAALSGMAVLSSAGFLTMMAIFGTGYVVAYFFRKLWIH
ncbi:MAG: YeeE/YedE thiosulfate transporter family protein [Bacteroidales bacterium]|nr:YeeE/YedE thiosulfate transporter family protein [Bacteroidales bacterium]MDP2236534.1 YeeE/YedE thiosulfate transporter family protein [Bacteroidales bacterium]